MGNCAGVSSSSKNSYPSGQRIQNSIIVYHGTSKCAAQKIIRDGFVPSSGGNRGAGVYFADKKESAYNYAKTRSASRKSSPVIFQCRISQNQVHGPWDSTSSSTFNEYVVKDPNRIKIVNVQY